MSRYLSLVSRSLLRAIKPHINYGSAVRPISVTSTMFATKKTPQAPKPVASPKPAAAAKATTKGDTYEAPEYYAYDPMSYYQMESDMRKGRLPQPKPGQPSN